MAPGNVDVDSASKHGNVKFNDTFHSPKEFFRDSFSATDLITHLQESLQLYHDLLFPSPVVTMNVYVIKISSEHNIHAIQNGQQFVHEGIYNFENALALGSPVFIYFGGDKAQISWSQGLAAVGRVAAEPYDKGYGPASPRNFRIKVDPLHVLPAPIPPKEAKLHDPLRYALYDVPYVGANHFPTQAIAQAGTAEGIQALTELYLEHDPTAEPVLRQLGLYPPAQPRLIADPGADYTAQTPPTLQLPPVILTAEEQDLKDLLLMYKQVIFYGPPGTGKSWHARRIAQTFDGFETAVFHPSLGYEDFVGGIRPQLTAPPDGADTPGAAPMTLQVEEYKGIFQEMCRRADASPQQNFVLLLDEINRGDIARLFGELIYAIEADKRGTSVALPYLAERTLTVPPNLFLIGTMNTSDRSITQLDVALRRRFAFAEIEPEPALLEGVLVGAVSLRAVMETLNTRLVQYRDRDHRIGQAYFLHPQTGQPLAAPVDLWNAWRHRILPLLSEYFYSDPARLAAVLGPSFLRAAPLADGADDMIEIYTFVTHAGENAFLTALQQFLGTAPAPVPPAPVIVSTDDLPDDPTEDEAQG